MSKTGMSPNPQHTRVQPRVWQHNQILEQQHFDTLELKYLVPILPRGRRYVVFFA